MKKIAFEKSAFEDPNLFVTNCKATGPAVSIASIAWSTVWTRMS